MPETRKRNYSYFIIKPDGIRFFDKIHDKLSSEFDTIKYFYIDDYRDLTRFVYAKHFKEKGESFSKGYYTYLDSLVSLYGNHALLAMIAVDREKESFDSLKRRVFDTKQALRKELIDPNVAIVSNTPTSGKQNRIMVVDEDGKEIRQRLFTKPGNYRINKFDVIHSPDLEEESTNQEIKMLVAAGVINYTNLIDSQSLREILKFKTLEGFEGNKIFSKILEEEQYR